jgi:UDP-N-acetylglucosamine 4,6-dehydratase/5-epimerase
MKLGSILITGGSGYLGRALTRRLLETDASHRICIFSRGEHAQADMREEFGNDSRLRFFLGDVRERSRLVRAFDSVSLVIHAAALKRIEVGAYNPLEVVRTNVDGTVNVIEAAQDAGVGKVLFVSSDKAYQPVSAYGQTKALAEALVLAAQHTVRECGPKFGAVRYGNVFNSAGSVVPKWREMVAQGKRITITDHGCTRFFMRRDEAVDLVLNTAAIMRGGELAIPDLPAYRLGDLAEAMGIDGEITGLPKWEKKHESMGPGHSSELARRMSVDELRAALSEEYPPQDDIGALASQISKLSCELGAILKKQRGEAVKIAA